MLTMTSRLPNHSYQLQRLLLVASVEMMTYGKTISSGGKSKGKVVPVLN
jgi:hypothetical protein